MVSANRIPIIAGAVVFVFTLGLLAWSFFISPASAPAPEQAEQTVGSEEDAPDAITQAADETTSIDTSHWQTYRSEEFGFEFQYPIIFDQKDSCELREGSLEQNLEVNLVLGNSITIHVRDSGGFSLEEYMATLGDAALTEYNKEFVTVAGQEAIKESYRVVGLGRYGETYHIIKNGKIYELGYFARSSCVELDLEKFPQFELSVLHQILSTFRFAEVEERTNPDSLEVGKSKVGNIELERIEPLLIYELDEKQDMVRLDKVDESITLKRDTEFVSEFNESYELYYENEKIGYGFIDGPNHSNTINIYSFAYNGKKYLLFTDTQHGFWSNSFTALHFYVLDNNGLHEITKQGDSISDVTADQFSLIGFKDMLLVFASDSALSPGISYSRAVFSLREQVIDSVRTEQCYEPFAENERKEDLENPCEKRPEILLFEKQGSLYVEAYNGREGAGLQYYRLSENGEFIDVTNEFAE